MKRCRRCGEFARHGPDGKCLSCGCPPVRVEVQPEPEHEQPKAPPVAAHASTDPAEFDLGGEG